MNPRNKSWLLYLLSILVGGFFIFSAITKILPIESFEYTIKSQLGTSDLVAAFAARFMVGLELALGLLLLLTIFGSHKWVIKMSFGLISVFTVHLAILYMNLGNDVNCGCMGDRFYMPPLQSIAKNLALLILLGLIWRMAPQTQKRVANIWANILLAVCLTLPAIVFPYQTTFLKLESLYSQGFSPSVNLDKGKQIIGFLSLTCPHCMVAAEKFTELKKEDASLPIHILFSDVKVDSVKVDLLDNFIKESGMAGLEYDFVDPMAFVQLAGGHVPAIFWIKDKTIQRKVNVSDLNLKEIQMWLKD